MSGTRFPSNPCYLPIHDVTPEYSLKKFTRVWQNFIWHNVSDLESSSDRLKAWNGTLINDAVVFDTEKDKMWFILRWS